MSDNDPINLMLADLAAAHKLPEPLHLTGDWMVCGDIHVPLYSPVWLRRLALVGWKTLKRPRQLLIAGDFFNMDAFSMYIHVVPPVSWAQERDGVRAAIQALLTVYDRIVIDMGNHERRAQKMTAGAFDESDILALVTTSDRVEMSPLGYSIITSGDHVWRVTHPRNYSINRLTVAGELALKFQSHIISLHEHHLGMAWDRYNRYCIINGGCLVDQRKLAYVSLDDSKSAVMQNGFVSLINGVPTLYGDAPITDWRKYEN